MENSSNYEDWSGKTILIGEDEMINYRLLEMILVKTNVRLLHGKTGLEVLNLFRTNFDISLILLDIKMPELDGIETVIEIRKINSLIPILAQTAYASEEDKEKCLRAGFNGFITKPINRKDLMLTIGSYF